MKILMLGDLSLEYLNGRIWKVENADQEFGAVVDGFEIKPADGFITDFASIPRFMWRILPPVGDGARARYGVGAVLHDWLYNSHMTSVRGMAVTKEFADNVFYSAMTALGVETWKKEVMFKAVSWFGGGSWKNGPARQQQLQNEALKYE